MGKILFIFIALIPVHSENSLLDSNVLVSPSIAISVSEYNQSFHFHFKDKIYNDIGYNFYFKTNYFNQNKINYQHRFTNSFLLGINFFWVQSFFGIERIKDLNTKFFVLETKIYKSQSLVFQYKENEFQKTYFLSNTKGEDLKLGFGIGKNFFDNNSEYFGAVSISFSFGNFELGAITNREQEKFISSGFIKYEFEKEESSFFGKEFNPTYEEKENLTKPKKEKKEFVKKEKIIYELRLDELLKEKIPLKISIQIVEASKDKEKYLTLEKKLPPEILRKLKKLQYEKFLEEQDE